MLLNNIANDLISYQYFLARHFKNNPQYESMKPYCNQPGCFFAKAETHKADSIYDTKKENLKLRPTLSQVNTCYYNASQVLAEYLKPLAENDFTLEKTQLFSKILTSILSLMPEVEDVSYDVESLFTNAPVEDTIKYIFHQIYVKKKIRP